MILMVIFFYVSFKIKSHRSARKPYITISSKLQLVRGPRRREEASNGGGGGGVGLISLLQPLIKIPLAKYSQD